MTDIKANCDPSLHASRTSGTRSYSEIDMEVLHDTEGGTALSNARYFHDSRTPAQGGPGGSAHRTVDDNACYLCLRPNEIPWGAASAFGANTHGMHLEMAAKAAWAPLVWTSHRRMLQRAAFKTAYDCVKFKIPVRFLFASDLVAG